MQLEPLKVVGARPSLEGVPQRLLDPVEVREAGASQA